MEPSSSSSSAASLFSVSPIATPSFVLLPTEGDRTLPTNVRTSSTTDQFSFSVEDDVVNNETPDNIERLFSLYNDLISPNGNNNINAGFGGLQDYLNKNRSSTSQRHDNNDCIINGRKDFYDNNNSYIVNNANSDVVLEELGVAASSCSARILPTPDPDTFVKIISAISSRVAYSKEGLVNTKDIEEDVDLVEGGHHQNPPVALPSMVIDLFQMDSSYPPSHFDTLPDELILLIFSYLDAEELSNIAVVCKKWNYLSSTDSLWRPMLNTDVRKWEVITHLSNPNLYQETDSEWTQKDIYRQCCPELRKWKIEPTFNFWKLTFFWNFFQKRLPKIGIFGPGLESRTKRIMQRILCDPNEGFKTTGIIPGSFSGVGSYFTMSVHGKTFNLTVMYSGTKEERENAAARGIRRLSPIEHMQQLKVLCRTLDGFVFVVDASDPASMNWAGKELQNVINERWAATHTPVLVLSCIPATTSGQAPLPTLSCIDIVKSLKLSGLTKPWQVRQCLVRDLSGAYEGMDWVLDVCEPQ